jgi:anthranilate phosphoribosyltransferase
LQEPQTGTLTELPELPSAIDAETTASFIRDVLEGKQAIPPPIAQQVAHIVQLAGSL